MHDSSVAERPGVHILEGLGGAGGLGQRARTGTASCLPAAAWTGASPQEAFVLCLSTCRVKEVYRLEEMEKIFVR